MLLIALVIYITVLIFLIYWDRKYPSFDKNRLWGLTPKWQRWYPHLFYFLFIIWPITLVVAIIIGAITYIVETIEDMRYKK